MTNLWTPSKELKYARYYHDCVSYNRKIIIVGGRNNGDVRQIESWTEEKGGEVLFPFEINQHRMISTNNIIYVVGGMIKREESNTIYELKLDKEVMEQVYIFERPRFAHMAILLPYRYTKTCTGKDRSVL